MANLKDLIVTGPARFLNKIYGNLEGNASTADKWKTARNFSISNRAGVGVAISIDGSSSGGYTLVIPNTISGFNSISTTSLTATDTITATTFSGSLSGNASSATIASYALKMQTYKNGSTTETWGTSYPLYAQWEESILKLKCDNYIVETDAATKLATARTINGTSFDGTVNITTANWGTNRTLTIGKSGKSVNGSGNVSWNLNEIGANSLDGSTYFTLLTGGDGNTPGYRLIGSSSIVAWANKRISFIVSSRHTGNGLILINYGCNSDTVSAASCYCTIRYFGASKGDNYGPIGGDSFSAYINSSGNTIYFFWEYHDYNYTYITVLNNNTNDLTFSNGTWMTSIPTSTYGTQIASTIINMADAVYDNANNSRITLSYGASGLSSASWFAAWNGYELRAISSGNTRNAISAMAAINANGYYGMGTPSGGTSDWIRTTTNGIIPYQSGGSSSLGTESWPFNSIYTNSLISYGPVKIGNNANGDTNYIAFYGTTSDGLSSYNHTYIGENFYGGSESSELVLFKGNDADNYSGPDRIRHIAAWHIFQTYDSALSGSWTTICDSAVPVTKFEIRPTWIRAHVTTSIGTETSSYALNTASFICDSWIRTKGATGLYNETYGGGLYMTDNTWMRVYNDKKLHVSNTDNNSIYTLGGVLAQTGFYNTQNGVSWYVQNNNSNFSHYTTSASIGHWFNKAVYVAGDIYAGTYFNDKVITASRGIQVFSRNDIGTSPNFDNPGVNGFFEIRGSSETSGETGTKPFNGFGAFLNLKTPDAIAMLQLAAISGGELMFRAGQAGNITMSGIAWKTLLSSSNYTNYTVTKTGGGASGTWGISITGSAATLDNSSAGTLTWSGDHMLSSSTRPNAKLHFGTDTLYQYRSSTYYIILDSGNYTSYTVTKTGSGASGTWGISITGNAATATKLQTARNIFGRMFDGTGNITGRALFYGSYNSSVNSRFSTAALEIRENGLVDNAQSDIGYAPQIGFHWSNRVAGTLALGSDAKFRFIKQDGSTATLVATLEGYASSAGSSSWSSLLSSYYEDPIPYTRNSFQYFNVYGTAGASVGVNDTPTTQWWHILRCTHNNGNGYYTDVAIPFNDNQIYYKRITNGALQNGGWVMVYDTKNLVYSSTAPSYPKAGTIWLKPA